MTILATTHSAHGKTKKEMISLNGVDYFPKQFAKKAFLD
jgi:hypothetical protein